MHIFKLTEIKSQQPITNIECFGLLNCNALFVEIIKKGSQFVGQKSEQYEF